MVCLASMSSVVPFREPSGGDIGLTGGIQEEVDTVPWACAGLV